MRVLEYHLRISINYRILAVTPACKQHLLKFHPVTLAVVAEITVVCHFQNRRSGQLKHSWVVPSASASGEFAICLAEFAGQILHSAVGISWHRPHEHQSSLGRGVDFLFKRKQV